jgi:hypothetical protein
MAGRQFDPMIVAAFCGTIEELRLGDAPGTTVSDAAIATVFD